MRQTNRLKLRLLDKGTNNQPLQDWVSFVNANFSRLDAAALEGHDHALHSHNYAEPHEHPYAQEGHAHPYADRNHDHPRVDHDHPYAEPNHTHPLEAHGHELEPHEHPYSDVTHDHPDLQGQVFEADRKLQMTIEVLNAQVSALKADVESQIDQTYSGMHQMVGALEGRLNQRFDALASGRADERATQQELLDLAGEIYAQLPKRRWWRR